LRFEEEVEIHLLVRQIRTKTVEYTFIFRKHQNGRQIEVARGSLIAVAVAVNPAKRSMRAVRIPAGIRAKIETAPAKLFKEEK
jgi:acyl-CoA thioesterase FadM